MSTTQSYSNYYFKRTNEPNYKFIQWINEIETIVFKEIGLKLLDLPDEPYMINFQDGLSPREIAESIIKSSSYINYKN